MKNSAMLRGLAWMLVIIGGVNWGLWGLFQMNLVEALFGAGFVSRVIYILVGISASYLIYLVMPMREAR